MSDAKAEKPLKPVPEPDKGPRARSEDEIRKAIAALMVRRQVAMAALKQLHAGREQWLLVSSDASELMVIEAHIEALQFALGERQSIN